MKVLAIKQRLIGYISDADDKKVKALYTLLENEIEDHSHILFSKDELEILEKEHQLHLEGKTQSYSWNEVKEIMRGEKAM